MFNPDVIALSRRYGLVAASRNHEVTFSEWPLVEEPISIDHPPPSVGKTMQYYQAANALRLDIYVGVYHRPEHPLSSEIPEPLCIFRGKIRRTLDLSDSEKEEYRRDTNWIRGKSPERPHFRAWNRHVLLHRRRHVRSLLLGNGRKRNTPESTGSHIQDPR